MKAVHHEKVIRDGSGYRDYAQLMEGNTFSCDAAATTGVPNTSAFPVSLHRLLSEVERLGMESIICWRPNGRCIIVHDPDAFEKYILPIWFRQKKYASFQRQLNLYGFQRLTQGFDKGAYYHEKFLGGKEFLSYSIKRTKTKGTGPRKSADPESEPDFKSMSILPASSKTKSPGPFDSPLLESAQAYLAATRMNTTRIHRNPSITLNPESVACLNDPTKMSLEQAFATSSVYGRTPSILRPFYPSANALMNSSIGHFGPVTPVTTDWESVMAVHHQHLQHDYPLLSSSWSPLALLAAERRRLADATGMFPAPTPSSNILLLQLLAERQGIVPPRS